MKKKRLTASEDLKPAHNSYSVWAVQGDICRLNFCFPSCLVTGADTHGSKAVTQTKVADLSEALFLASRARDTLHSLGVLEKATKCLSHCGLSRLSMVFSLMKITHRPSTCCFLREPARSIVLPGSQAKPSRSKAMFLSGGWKQNHASSFPGML